MVTGTESKEVLGGTRSYSDLPHEILSFIASRLTLIELLTFRAICKDFRSASSTASVKLGSSTTPWLLLHKTNNSECILYDPKESKIYNWNIPDLEGAICLASDHGWLLLSKNESIFFLSPFSLAKIKLPDFPHKQMLYHAATFSDLPTSPHCIVSIFNRTHIDEVHIISKGESVWTQHKVTKYVKMSGTLNVAVFLHKSHTSHFGEKRSEDITLAFSMTRDEWKYVRHWNRTYWLPDSNNTNKDLIGNRVISGWGVIFKEPNGNCHTVYRDDVGDFSSKKSHMRRKIWIQPRFFEAHLNHRW